MTNQGARERVVGINTHLSSTEKRIKSVNRQLRNMFGNAERVRIKSHVREHFEQAAWMCMAAADEKCGLNTEKPYRKVVATMEAAFSDMQKEWEQCAAALAEKEEEVKELRQELKAKNLSK